jgi:hypothetical protein
MKCHVRHFEILNRLVIMMSPDDDETNRISPETKNDLLPATYGIHWETNHLYRERFDLSRVTCKSRGGRVTAIGASK